MYASAYNVKKLKNWSDRMMKVYKKYERNACWSEARSSHIRAICLCFTCDFRLLLMHVHTASRSFNSLNRVKFRFEPVIYARTNQTATSREYFYYFFFKLKISSSVINMVRAGAINYSRNMKSLSVFSLLLLLSFINKITFSIDEKSDLIRELLVTKIFT